MAAVDQEKIEEQLRDAMIGSPIACSIGRAF